MEKVIHYVKNHLVKPNSLFNPIIVTDIDGVLLRGSTPITGTLEALRRLKKQNIPVACLTNGGGQLESQKVLKMNKIFNEELFSPQLMFMNHTPVRPKLIEYSRKEGIILITGSGGIKEIVDDLNITNYLTVNELWTLFHQKDRPIFTHSDLQFHSKIESIEQTEAQIGKRFNSGVRGSYDEWCGQINSIFALNDVHPYEKSIEVIHNVFSTQFKRNKTLPPYFASQNDIVWAGGYHRPRMAFGPFNFMLEEHCNFHNYALTKHYFGKPSKQVYQFVEKSLISIYGKGCFFMVGDNPRADIKGANKMGWASFLTQTGVHHGSLNDEQNPATLVVHNFEQAADIILRIKKNKLWV